MDSNLGFKSAFWLKESFMRNYPPAPDGFRENDLFERV